MSAEALAAIIAIIPAGIAVVEILKMVTLARGITPAIPADLLNHKN
jgi:hypothetical protein